jgi:hypothetical protein
MVEDNEKSKDNDNGDSLQIKADSLKQKIDKGEGIFILDARRT